MNLPKPSLLLLSHCVPNALGHADRARAWQWLRLASRTHVVHLVCLQDGPVSWADWSRLRRIAASVQLERPSVAAGKAASAAWLTDPARAERMRTSMSLRHSLTQQLADRAFDLIVYTDPCLHDAASRVIAGRRICDVSTANSVLHRQAAGACRGLRAQWHAHAARCYRALELSAAAEVDALTVSHAEAAHPFVTCSTPTLLLPDAFDLEGLLDSLGEDVPRRHEPAMPTVVFHADPRHALYRTALSRFRQDVWPSIEQAVDGVRLTLTGRDCAMDDFRALRGADVVVSPTLGSERSRWPILQAMAADRPVVAAQASVDDLPLQHGRHALLCEHPADWARHCIDSIRDGATKLKLSCGARSFIAEHCSIERHSQTLHDWLRPAQPPLRAAA